MLENLHKENDNIKVFGPSTKALKRYLLFAGIASIPSVVAIVKRDVPVTANIFSYLIVFLAAASCLAFWSFYKGLPQIKLSSKGIEVCSIIGKEFHSWASAGPFRTHKLDNKYMDARFLCAHSRETEETLRRGNNYIPADHENSDIVISLQGLAADLSDEEAEKLCHDINVWRERYSPDKGSIKSTQQDNLFQVKAHLKRKKLKAKIRVYSMVALVMAIIFYYVVWEGDYSDLKDSFDRIQELSQE